MCSVAEQRLHHQRGDPECRELPAAAGGREQPGAVVDDGARSAFDASAGREPARL